MKVFKVLDLSIFLSTFPFFRDRVPGGWTHVSEDLGSHFLCDGEAGYTLEDFITDFDWFVEGFNFQIFVFCPFLRDRSASW